MSDPEIRLIDKRTVERYLKMGLVDEKVWEKIIKSLPDLADKAVKVESTLQDTDFDDEDQKD